MLPIGCFVTRQTLLPAFSDYSVELNRFASRLVYFPSAACLSIASVVVLLGACVISGRTQRHVFMRIAGVSGVLIGLVYVVFFVGPVLSLLHALG